MRKSRVSQQVRRGTMVAAASLLALTAAGTAAADIAHPDVVQENAANWTPALVNGQPKPIVDAITVSGDTVFAGGRFTRVEQGGNTVQRQNVVAFDATTGAMRNWDLNANNRVWAMTTIGNWVYIGGTFTNLGGSGQRNLVRVNATTGQIDPGFNSAVNGRINVMVPANGRLYVGGSFGQRLVALNPETGANTGHFDLAITNPLPNAWGNVSILGMTINPQGTRLVATGNFRTVAGQSRTRLFVADISGAQATLDNWYYDRFEDACSSTHPRRIAYLQGVDFSPDGSYFVVVATGQIPRGGDLDETVCDGAGRFDMNDDSQPQWINYTGGDSVWSVSVTGAAAYVQGHFQWLDNRNGFASMPRGDAVRRLGIGAINPQTGRAHDWDPAKRAAIGGRALVATPQGLWVGSDSVRFGNEAHRGLAFVPLP